MIALIFIALGTLSFLAVALSSICSNHFFGTIIGLTGTTMCSMLLCSMSWSWISAGHKADFINKACGTEYTQSDVFYAHDYLKVDCG